MREIRAVLHNIRSVHNVASMFRTADGAGVSRVYVSGYSPDPVGRSGKLRPQFTKVALGAEDYIEWERADDLEEILGRLSEDGFLLVALELAPHAQSLYEWAPSLPLDARVAFVVGHEVEGVPQDVLSRCDEVVEIPMHGKKESLNVSVAFGIAAYAIRELIP